MEIKPYTVTLWSFIDSKAKTHVMQAYSAEDAWFQAQRNICDKSLIVRDVAKGFEPSCQVYTVEPCVQ